MASEQEIRYAERERIARELIDVIHDGWSRQVDKLEAGLQCSSIRTNDAYIGAAIDTLKACMADLEGASHDLLGGLPYGDATSGRFPQFHRPEQIAAAQEAIQAEREEIQRIRDRNRQMSTSGGAYTATDVGEVRHGNG